MFWIKLFFVTIGTLVLLLAAVGMVRLPDVYMRMSAATKGATLGMICLLVAVGLHFQDTTVTARALATIAFVIVTAPVAAHMIGRAAYYNQIALWEGTITDEYGRDLALELDKTRRQAESNPQPNIEDTLD